MRSDDDDDVDSQDYARLLDPLYDTSFRNIAEGEVVKAGAASH